MTGNGVSAGPAPGLKNEKNRIREEMLKARLSVPEDVKLSLIHISEPTRH